MSEKLELYGLKANAASKYYLTNGDLLPEVIKSKELGRMTDKLARMLMLLVDRYSRRPNFNGYSFKQDMVSEALVNLCQNALKFNPEKSSNPFAFYTTAIHHSFLQYMNGEKKQRNIRDMMLIESGENPSYNYGIDGNRGQLSDDIMITDKETLIPDSPKVQKYNNHPKQKIPPTKVTKVKVAIVEEVDIEDETNQYLTY